MAYRTQTQHPQARRTLRQGKRARVGAADHVDAQHQHAPAAQQTVRSSSPASGSVGSSSNYTDESEDEDLESHHGGGSPRRPARLAYRQPSRLLAHRSTRARLRRLTAGPGGRVLTPKPSNHFVFNGVEMSPAKGSQKGGTTRQQNTVSPDAVPERKIHPLPHQHPTLRPTRRTFRVHNDHHSHRSSSYGRGRLGMTTLRRTLRKRSRAEAQLDSPETEAEGDDEDLVEAPLRHRQPSNVVDLTTTDEEDEMVTASEGPSSDIEPDSAEDADAEYYLHYATSSQLNKLRKPTLVHLLTQLKIDYPSSFDMEFDESSKESEEDSHNRMLEDLPKHTLLSSLLSAREHQARLSGSPPPSSTATTFLEAPSTPSPRKQRGQQATGMTRSTSLPTLPDATPGTTRTQHQRGHRRAARSISLMDRDLLDDDSGSAGMQHTLRNGKVLQLSAVPEVATPPPPQPTRLTRSTSRLNHLTLNDSDDEDDGDDAGEQDLGPILEPTPVAHRTRSAHSSADSSGSPGASHPSSGRSQRRLRNGKTVVIEAADVDSAEPADASENSDGHDHDSDDASSTEEEAAEEEEDEDTEQENQAPVDVATATANQLLRLRRPDLVELCEHRDLVTEGTKKDMVAQLMAWRRAHRADDNASNSSGDETEHEMLPAPKTVVAAGGRGGRGKKTASGTRGETKTQALAQLDTTIPSRPGLPPLLLDPHKPRRQSRPEAHFVGGDDEDDEEEDDGESHPQQQKKTKQRRSRAKNDAEKTQEEDEASVALDLEKLKLKDKAILPDAIVKAEKIGSGGFKDVYRGTYRKIKVAICDIRGVMSDNEIKELSLLRDLRHENVVKLVGVVAYDQVSDIPCSLVTELCLNGDLFDYVRRDAPVPPFERILKVMLDIASGLDYLHNRTPKIIHRDMKSSNVLITARGVAKITDFGLARVKNTTRSMIRSLVGTVNWQAPELWVAHPRYNEKVDCYAAGLVFWECLQWHQPVKKYPFEGMNEHAIYQEVGQRQLRPSTAGMGRHWGAEILDLVNRLWSQAPADRPSMREAIEELQVMRRQARKQQQ